jgi:hypothetical protein
MSFLYLAVYATSEPNFAAIFWRDPTHLASLWLARIVIGAITSRTSVGDSSWWIREWSLGLAVRHRTGVEDAGSNPRLAGSYLAERRMC